MRFNVSTVGYTNIIIAFEQQDSATCSRYWRLQYTTNAGSDWVDTIVIDMGTVVARQYRSKDLAGVAGVENNPNFAFRIVSEYESTAIGSAGAGYTNLSGGVLGTGGTFRLDQVNLFGTPLPVQITSDPTNLTACAGSTVNFYVTAIGHQPLSYQWQKNGVDISGATTTTLTLSAVALGDAASYAAVVTNDINSITSGVATLTVVVPPTITTDLTNITAAAGSTTVLSIGVAGTSPAYQWRKNGINLTDSGDISGSATANLTISH